MSVLRIVHFTDDFPLTLNPTDSNPSPDSSDPNPNLDSNPITRVSQIFLKVFCIDLGRDEKHLHSIYGLPIPRINFNQFCMSY